MSDIIMKTAAPAMPPLIPKPARYEAAPGAFDLRRHEILVPGGAGSLSPPERALVETAFAGWDAVGLRLGFTAGRAAEGGPESAPEAPRLVVALDPGRAGASGTAVAREAGPPLGRDERYAIAITPREARIEAAGAAGVSLAFRTLAQLASFAEPRLSLPCCRIEDCPAAAVRGFMHDVARNFQELPTLEAQIDLAASYKLNLFQWHLTDYHAWRIESRRFPSLNSPEVGPRGRRPERHYSYAEIRGLIAYAKARNVFVIPEIEMPGHSTAFRKALGFRMESRRGMRALDAILEEFCDEVPVEDAPIVHIGSEEIRIPNARAFLGRIVGFLESRGRRVMLWSPGLGRPRGALLQAWDAEGAPAEGDWIDSSDFYVNNMDLQGSVPSILFREQTKSRNATSKPPLGAVLCHWPDVAVADEADIYRHSPYHPALLAFAERFWRGRPSEEACVGLLPPPGGAGIASLAEFESRLASHRDRFFADKPFYYLKQAHLSWRVAGPLPPPAWGRAGEFSNWRFDCWHSRVQELPFVDEEFYFTRPPALLSLGAGWNLLSAEIPSTYGPQYWAFTCMPLAPAPGGADPSYSGAWREREDLAFSAWPRPCERIRSRYQ